MAEEITTSLDSAYPLSEAELSVLRAVDEALEQSIRNRNPMAALHLGIKLRMAQHVAGVGLAKLLYGLRAAWDQFDIADDCQTFVEYEMGISGQTYHKYVDTWESVLLHPYVQEHPELYEALLCKPIQGLMYLRVPAREGLMTPDDWEEAAKAPNVAALRVIRDRLRGFQTSTANRLFMRLDKGGVLWARIGDDSYEERGFIKRDDSELCKRILSRLERMGVVIEEV